MELFWSSAQKHIRKFQKHDIIGSSLQKAWVSKYVALAQVTIVSVKYILLLILCTLRTM